MIQRSNHKRFTCRAAFLFALAVVLGLGITSIAEASIWVPSNGLMDDNSAYAEQLIISQEKAQEKQKATSSTSTSSTTGEPALAGGPHQQKEDQPQHLAALGSQTGGSTSGASTSSSGSSSAGSGASLLADTTVILPGATPARRYVFESALLLPDAPGNQLLRPPQA